MGSTKGRKQVTKRSTHAFFFCNTPALSSDKALGFTTRSLHQCCRAQYSHPIYRVAEKANLDLCLQRIPMHGSAAGTATPKQPKNSGIQRFNKVSLRFLFVRFHKVAVVQKHICCPLHSKPKQAKWHSTHWVRGPAGAGGGMGSGGQVG